MVMNCDKPIRYNFAAAAAAAAAATAVVDVNTGCEQSPQSCKMNIL